MSFYQEYLKKQKERKAGTEIEKKLEETKQPVEEKFSDIQKEEEIEREAFINRVRGENIPEPPVDKDMPEDNLRISVPQKPAKSKKFLIRLIIIIALLALIGVVSFFLYRTIQERWVSGPAEIQGGVEVKEAFLSEAIAPRSLFNYTRLEYPSITSSDEFTTQFLQYMNERVDEETIVKVVFRDQQNTVNPTFITVSSFLDAFSITMPTPFNDRVDQESLNAFVHLRERDNEAGFAVAIKETEGFTRMMREWENRAVGDVRPFFSFLGKTTQQEAQTFVPLAHHRNIIRCLNRQNISNICYARLNNIFVFATSLDTIKALIDSL